MKRVLTFSFLALAICFASANAKELKCGKYKEHQLYLGKKGGCFYRLKGKNNKMEKVYVEKENCKNCN